MQTNSAQSVLVHDSEKRGHELIDLLNELNVRTQFYIGKFEELQLSGQVSAIISKDPDFLEKSKSSFPNISRIYLVEKPTGALVADAINSNLATKILLPTQSAIKRKRAIQEAIELFEQGQNMRLLLKEFNQQNREMESLNKDLESIVEERTFHIQISESEERDKVNRLRNLIKFIKSLTTVEYVDELLEHFRLDIRKFHGLLDPILAYRITPQRWDFTYLRSGKVRHLKWHGHFEQDNRQQIANILGRPLGQLITFPLIGDSAFLLVEHQLAKGEQKLFFDYVNERAPLMALTLERVLLEEQLKKSSYRWEATFDGIKDPIVIIDQAYNLIRANRYFSEFSGGKKCHSQWANSDSICEGCPIAQVFTSMNSQSGQVRRGGRLYEVHSYPIRMSEGLIPPSNVVNHYVDVTQSRELYSRMIQSEKMGAVGLLAGNIAHELNNPLSGLRSLAQALAAEQSEGSQIKGDLIEIEKAAKRSQGIIKNLLEFSQGQAESVTIEIDELVNKTLPMLKTATRSHRTEIQLNASGVKVKVQPHLIQQILFNLVNNACQAMKEKGQITLKTEHQSHSGQRGVLMRVIDSGPGVPEEIRSRIFEPFFTTKKEGSGTGLGLSMAKSVLESFGGKIEYQPVKPTGSEFCFWLPEASQ